MKNNRPTADEAMALVYEYGKNSAKHDPKVVELASAYVQIVTVLKYQANDLAGIEKSITRIVARLQTELPTDEK